MPDTASVGDSPASGPEVIAPLRPGALGAGACSVGTVENSTLKSLRPGTDANDSKPAGTDDAAGPGENPALTPAATAAACETPLSAASDGLCPTAAALGPRPCPATAEGAADKSWPGAARFADTPLSAPTRFSAGGETSIAGRSTTPTCISAGDSPVGAAAAGCWPAC